MGLVPSSYTTSADDRPCTPEPATGTATAGMAAAWALVAGRPVSGAMAGAGDVGRAELGGRPVAPLLAASLRAPRCPAADARMSGNPPLQPATAIPAATTRMAAMLRPDVDAIVCVS